MNIIKYRIKVEGSTVHFQILEQHEALRGGYWEERVNYANLVSSVSYPAITPYGDTIFIMGYSRDNDGRESAVNCDSAAKAHRRAADIIDALNGLSSCPVAKARIAEWEAKNAKPENTEVCDNDCWNTIEVSL